VRTSLALLVVALVGCAPPAGDGGAGGGKADGDSDRWAEKLRALPGVHEVTQPYDGVFELAVDQPVDHDHPEGEHFLQHVHILHRGADRPVVLGTEGYWLAAYPEEPTELVGANQVSVEYRYNGASVPASGDYRFLTGKQGAADHHRIVELLRPLYPKRWINTGVSKGGVSALVHRRYYPDDVVATVAYSAPFMFGAPDNAYLAFWDRVPASCRTRIQALQRELLRRREVMELRLRDYGVDQNAPFTGASIAAYWDTLVVHWPWYMFQYDNPGDCILVPDTSASDEVLFAYIAIEGVSYGAVRGPAEAAKFAPFFRQSYREIGFPKYPTEHLADLLSPGSRPDLWNPTDAALADAAPLDTTVSREVRDWVQDKGERILVVYGTLDPWAQGAVTPRGADTFRFDVAGANHGASISGLPNDDRTMLKAKLRAWAEADSKSDDAVEDAAPAPAARAPRYEPM
jgi:hypothetical protein